MNIVDFNEKSEKRTKARKLVKSNRRKRKENDEKPKEAHVKAYLIKRGT